MYIYNRCHIRSDSGQYLMVRRFPEGPLLRLEYAQNRGRDIPVIHIWEHPEHRNKMLLCFTSDEKKYLLLHGLMFQEIHHLDPVKLSVYPWFSCTHLSGNSFSLMPADKSDEYLTISEDEASLSKHGYTIFEFSYFG